MSLFLQVGKTKRIAFRSVRNETVLAHTIDGWENLSVQRDDSARGIPNEFAFGFFRLSVPVEDMQLVSQLLVRILCNAAQPHGTGGGK